MNGFGAVLAAGLAALAAAGVTDVIGGVWVGAGAVFFIDALVHLPWVLLSREARFDRRLAGASTTPPVHA